MDYATALKQVKAAKPEPPYVLVRLSYDKKLVLPYKQGMDFMASLDSAEVLVEEWGKNASILSMKKEEIVLTMLSREEYVNIKVSNLLNISLEDLAESQKTTT